MASHPASGIRHPASGIRHPASGGRVGALAVLGMAAMAFHGPLLTGESVHVADDHVAPAPALGDGLSFEQPLRVTRDNVWFGEELELFGGESASCPAPSTYCSTFFRWTGVEATLHADEWRRDGSRPALGNPLYFRVPKTIGTLVRPAEGAWSGPGTAEWQTRSFDLVPGNVYEIRQRHRHASGALHQSPSSLFVTLADDVLVVPVAVINWVTSSPLATFENLFELRGRALFDFEATSTSFLFTSVLEAIGEPDDFEIPPDDIWAQCGIQF